jgi:tetratricopeptide (TPR) repeat protein
VEKDSSIGGFMRFIFRRSGSLIGLYIGLVFAYGSIGYLNSTIGMETLTRLLTGVVAASGLLHFYYDGFIWKVREKSTRQSLGLAGGTADLNLSGFLPGWALHASKWAVAFVVPLAAMSFGKLYRSGPPEDRTSHVAADLPASARAHYNYGAVLQPLGRFDEAEKEYQAALRIDPGYTKAVVNMATILMSKSKLDEAKKYYDRAIQLDPNSNASAGRTKLALNMKTRFASLPKNQRRDCSTLTVPFSIKEASSMRRSRNISTLWKPIRSWPTRILSWRRLF